LIRQRFNEAKAALVKRGLVEIRANLATPSEANERERKRNGSSDSFGGNRRTERNGVSIDTGTFVRTRTESDTDDMGADYEEF